MTAILGICKLGFSIVLLLLMVTTVGAQEVAFDASDAGRVVIKVGGEAVAHYVYEDADISRPYFAHVRAPGGPQVTRTHPPVEGVDRADHPTFHPGLWMSFGDLSGSDYWRLKACVEQVDLKVDADANSFAVENRYLAQEDESATVCQERCTYTIEPRPAGFLLVWESVFSSDEDFYFGDQEEMGLGIRVATPIRVEGERGEIPAGTGKMVDAEGRVNGAEIWGNAADWCDYSGTLDGKHVGIALLCHPDNFRPSWFHARDYGLLEANPFGRAAFKRGETSRVEVAAGEQFRLRYGVFVHSSPAGESPDLAAEFRHYVEVAK